MSKPPRSLVRATDLDVLPLDHTVERRDDHLVVRSPSNPTHHWGNLLLFDAPPQPGDGHRWEALFADAFADEPRVRHVTFAWDDPAGGLGAGAQELIARGYHPEECVGLVATPATLREHPRENREVTIRPLDPSPDGDAELWEQVVAVQVAGRDKDHDADSYTAYIRSRLADLRALFRLGRGAWYVALDPDSAVVVGSCGVVVTAGRGRFQQVDTRADHRRRGICSRLVVAAARHATRHHGAERFVIAADPGYHALGLYESLGFEAVERVGGVCRKPPAA